MHSNEIVFVIFVLLCLKDRVGCEPHCSRFHYEERTLEKMIRLELLVEKLQSRIEETQKQTQDTLSDIRKFEHKLSGEFTDFKERTGLNFKEQTDNVNSLIDSLSFPTVVFQARHPSTLNPGTGAKIVFTKTMQDSSHSYDNITGVYRAPFAGTYLFNVQLCLATGTKYIHYAIIVETKAVTNTLLYDSGQRFCNSATAIVILQQDDDVHIQVIATNGNALQEANGEWNTFTGVMLQK